jgi:hypothetical protein
VWFATVRSAPRRDTAQASTPASISGSAIGVIGFGRVYSMVLDGLWFVKPGIVDDPLAHGTIPPVAVLAIQWGA